MPSRERYRFPGSGSSRSGGRASIAPADRRSVLGPVYDSWTLWRKPARQPSAPCPSCSGSRFVGFVHCSRRGGQHQRVCVLDGGFFSAVHPPDEDLAACVESHYPASLMMVPFTDHDVAYSEAVQGTPPFPRLRHPGRGASSQAVAAYRGPDARKPPPGRSGLPWRIRGRMKTSGEPLPLWATPLGARAPQGQLIFCCE